MQVFAKLLAKKVNKKAVLLIIFSSYCLFDAPKGVLKRHFLPLLTRMSLLIRNFEKNA